MTRIFKKALLLLGSLLGLFLVVGGLATALRQHRKFEAPLPDIHASKDPRVIERGRYLVFGPAHCADCHGDLERRAELESGSEIPLTGGMEFHLPVGVFRVPNITPDGETGIGRYRDVELARMLRHGVRPDGEAVLPFMPFADLSDADLTAVISFLRTTTPVRHRIEPHDVNALGRVIKAFVLAPRGPSGPVKREVQPAETAEYGHYLAHSVANCVGCHTRVDMRTGAFAGPLFGGGAVHPSTADPSRHFVAPNLTPDPRWGWLRGWSEDAFVGRLHAGRAHAGSPMPWSAFRRLTDGDLRAIYRYLQTLPPAAGGPDPRDRSSSVERVAER